QMTMPELQFGGLPFTPALKPANATGLRDKKSANWLVDAMMKTPERSSGRDKAGKDESTDESEAGTIFSVDAKNSSEPLSKRELANKDVEKPKEHTEPTVNPLTPFM